MHNKFVNQLVTKIYQYGAREYNYDIKNKFMNVFQNFCIKLRTPFLFI